VIVAAHADSPAGNFSFYTTQELFRFIETYNEINGFMIIHVINLAERALRHVGKRLYGVNVTVIGLAFKKNINDSRESPAIKIVEELGNHWGRVLFYDTFTHSLMTKAGMYTSAGSVEVALSEAECTVFLVDHDVFQGISIQTVKWLIESPFVVDGMDLIEGGGEVECVGVGKGVDLIINGWDD